MSTCTVSSLPTPRFFRLEPSGCLLFEVEVAVDVVVGKYVIDFVEFSLIDDFLGNFGVLVTSSALLISLFFSMLTALFMMPDSIFLIAESSICNAFSFLKV